MRSKYVFVNSMACVLAKPKQYIIYLNSPQEMAAHGLALLVEELGTEGARLFLRKEFSRYRRDYRGHGRDDRDARENDPNRYADVGAQNAADQNSPAGSA